MAWEQLSINRPHLVYIILGGFTSIFMLVSLFIKEKLYIGEATVATICGVIFGPHAANLINPLEWGNTDQITLEFSRIVLVVQCFAVGVELPKAYMERHWRSVVFLLVPVMAFGWLITSLFIWWLIEPLTWLESLAVAACVTATDPVLASSVVGKGKFAKRVPKHLRDILSAESGCNDGMAFPFIYLALYLLRYHLDAAHVTYHWFCFTILYECVFGAFYGFMVGYIARHAIKLAERKGVIDRESFLVFYFVLALFCAGSGSMLGMDDLLIGFAAGVGFSNDGWFTEKTEESHVSNVIDLLLNLTYFVYFGTIIPWDQFNAPDHGLEPWRLVCIAILVLFFRRIPIMMALKPIIPDVKTWREALFAGHFGPIGVGAIFVAILARAELETDSTTPLAELPAPDDPEYTLIYTIWPIVTFLVIASIIVHGSSIAVFTLGKRINTLTLTYSYTTGNEKSSAWMNRLPRISSQGRSMSKMSDEEMSIDKDFPAGLKLALRRQRDEEYEKPGSRSSSLRPLRRRKRKDYGGPISQSAIIPARRDEFASGKEESGASTPMGKPTPVDDLRASEKLDSGEGSSGSSPTPGQTQENLRRGRSQSPSDARAVDIEAYEEGGKLVIEDEEGNVLTTVDTEGKTDEDKAAIIEKARKKLAADKSGEYTKHKHESHPKNEGEDIEENIEKAVEPSQKSFKKAFENWKGFGKKAQSGDTAQPSPARRRGPAHAYQFGNTIIVEDEDGEVIKKYTIPGAEGQQRRFTYGNDQVRSGLQRMGTWVGLSHKPDKVAAEASGVPIDKLQEVKPDQSDESAVEARPDTPEKKGEMADESSKPEKPEKPKRRATNTANDDGEDDGLRLTVSKADRYGLTGLQKRKAQEGKEDETVALGRGRRMTTRDLFESLQQMDAKSKARAAEILGTPEIRQGLTRQQSDLEVRPSARSYASNVVREPRVDEESDDYFSPRRPAQIARSETDRPKSGGRPQTHRQDTVESIQSVEVPTHDALSTIARVGHGTTAADLRRQRLSTQYERVSEGHEGAADQDDERETAAERRRRLAALGMGGANESDSDVSDTEAPRRPKETAVREPGESPPPARRIQWGGESGREKAGRAEQETTAQPKSGEAPSHSSSGVGKKFRGFLKR